MLSFESVFQFKKIAIPLQAVVIVMTGVFVLPSAYAYGDTGPVSGGQIYNQYCAVCHKAGLNAAPKIGKKALWAKRIRQGREKVYENAINGLRGMPARGGYPGLTDEEVKAATDYMVGRSGGWAE